MCSLTIKAVERDFELGFVESLLECADSKLLCRSAASVPCAILATISGVSIPQKSLLMGVMEEG